MERLQNILSREPSEETWEQLIECLDNWPDFPSLSAAVDYAEQQLEEWPDELRIPPQRQWQAIQDGAPLPSWWRLIRHLQLGIDDNIFDLFSERGLENITSIELIGDTYFLSEELKLLGRLDKLGTLRSSDLKDSIVELLEDEDEDIDKIWNDIDEIWNDIEDQVSDLPSIDTVPAKYWKEIREGKRPVPQWWKLVRHLELGEEHDNLIEQDNCEVYCELSPIEAFINLTSIKFNSVYLYTLEELEPLTGLTSLELSDDLATLNIKPLSKLKQLIYLSRSFPELEDVDGLEELKKLLKLNLSYNFGLTDIESLAALSQLKWLSLEECPELNDLTPLSQINQLETLDLRNCKSVSDLSPLASLHQLDYLYLSGCDRITDLSPLANLQSLTTLDLNGCPELNDLTPLSRLNQLKSLNLSNCKSVSDLSPLASLHQLDYLYLSGCDRITDMKFGKSVIASIVFWPPMKTS